MEDESTEESETKGNIGSQSEVGHSMNFGGGLGTLGGFMPLSSIEEVVVQENEGEQPRPPEPKEEWREVINKRRTRNQRKAAASEAKARRSLDHMCQGACCLGDLAAVDNKEGKWAEIEITVDSGAVDRVMPTEVGKQLAE